MKHLNQNNSWEDSAKMLNEAYRKYWQNAFEPQEDKPFYNILAQGSPVQTDTPRLWRFRVLFMTSDSMKVWDFEKVAITVEDVWVHIINNHQGHLDLSKLIPESVRIYKDPI